MTMGSCCHCWSFCQSTSMVRKKSERERERVKEKVTVIYSIRRSTEVNLASISDDKRTLYCSRQVIWGEMEMGWDGRDLTCCYLLLLLPLCKLVTQNAMLNGGTRGRQTGKWFPNRLLHPDLHRTCPGWKYVFIHLLCNCHHTVLLYHTTTIHTVFIWKLWYHK